MKVVHVITSLATGGAEKLIVDSLPKYSEKIDVDLIVLKDAGEQSIFKEKLDNKFKGEVFYLTNKSLYNPLLILKIARFLKKYEVAHIHLFPTIYWTVLAKVLFFCNTKLVFTEHNTTNKRRDILYLKPIERFIYSKLDFIGCISEATMLNLQKHLKHNRDYISIVLNGIDLKNFNNLKETEFSFFSETNFVLIQVSSFREQKDQPTLIKALRYLPKEITLLLVGDGHLRHANEELVRSLELQSRVQFLGIREDIPALLNYSDVCILSSHYEGFGLAVLEGMASGKPSIASNLDGVKEIVDGYGLLFERGDSQALANHILKLYDDKLYYNEVAEKCLERSKEFDINKMVQQYIEIYKKVLNK